MVDVLAYAFSEGAVEVIEEAFLGFTFGHVMAMVQSFYRFIEDEEMTEDAMLEVAQIVRRRKPEILAVFREEHT